MIDCQTQDTSNQGKEYAQRRCEWGVEVINPIQKNSGKTSMVELTILVKKNWARTLALALSRWDQVTF